MDYRGFGPGATVYLPVEEPGALFFLGDGHVVQGDGEIVGTGIEISMDVRFRVELLPGRRVNWPRAENDDYIMTVGNARPLDQCVEYDLANVFDPAYTMVCKIRKNLLRAIGEGV